MSWTVFIVVMVGLLFLFLLALMIHEAGSAEAWREMARRSQEINDKLLERK
ncbi:MAG: hypothetical protein V4568_14560 [Pseudomonadota bacterium]